MPLPRPLSNRGALPTAAATLLYSGVLWWGYRDLSTLYAYRGLTYRDPDPTAYATAIALTVTLAVLLPNRIRRPSDFLQWALFVIAVAPSIQVAQYARTLTVDQAVATSFAVAGAALWLRLLVAAGPRIEPLQWPSDASVVWFFLALMTTAIYAYLALGAGLDFRLVSITEVYDLRGEFKEAAGGSALLGYLVRIQANVINPVYIARGIYSRRSSLVLLGFGGQLVIYAGTGFKSVLFSTPAIIAIALLFRSNLRPTGSRVVGATAVGALVCLGLDRLTGSILWSSLFLRRLILVPGGLTAAYVMVFGPRDKSWFSDLPLIPGNADYNGLTASRLVGGVFVGDYGTAANTGLFGHGYLNAGFLGMFIEASFVALLFWGADQVSHDLPTPVTALILTVPVINFANASPFTVLLTHGYAVALIALAVLPRTGWNRRVHSPGLSSAASEKNGSALASQMISTATRRRERPPVTPRA